MDNDVRIWQAGPGDEPVIVDLVQELATSAGWHSPVNQEFATAYLSALGCGVLLAQERGKTCGLLSYTLRPNLFHAGEVALVEELVVSEGHRGRGVGHGLMETFLQAMVARGCVEVSVSTMLDNEGARRFYRAHGFQDEALLLERHLL